MEQKKPVWQHLNGRFYLDEEMAITYTQDLIMRSHHPVLAGNNHELVMAHLENEKVRTLIQHIPSLIIQGDADPLSLPKDGYAIAQAIPDSNLHMMPGMGQMLFNRDLEIQVAKLISEHMKKAILKQDLNI